MPDPDLILDVRLDGFESPIGKLSRGGSGAVSFRFTDDYLIDPETVRLSLALPPRVEPYGDVETRAFFGNLLQERDQALQHIREREGLAVDDIAGLLLHLGKDCAGAISVLPEGAPPVKVPGDLTSDYEPLSDERLREIVESLHRRRQLPENSQDPSPLAGVQSKIALTVLPDGRYAEPKPDTGAPTTHILKVPDARNPRDARHEQAALDLCRAAGFRTADTRIVRIGNIEALLITRYDRATAADGRIVRIHQEDFAQALGLPPSLKYERNGREGRRFDVAGIARVLNTTSSPAEERLTFIRATLLDMLVGNADGHAKNFSLLHESGGRTRSAPRYDVLPTRLDPSLTDEFAYRIGGAERLDEVTEEEFEAFLGALGIGTAAARRRLRRDQAQSIAGAIAPQLAEYDRDELKPMADLIAANMRMLLPALGCAVPAEAENRDAFVNRGGGWAMS
ncbi:HipA domain-containing protein [Chthonobacter albigriseus]|uniref:HipA domain-containing protein n=1 Tax=Chthonobacter albigriseus TaxID=1683161 RepID=UPI0015EF9504|nr:HipA domain-containing protein [Chthonobacter albigriseus]